MMLGLTLLLNWTSFSQTDTSKLFISYKVARLIAIDLIQGDSAMAELEQTQVLLEQVSAQSTEKDTVIGFYVKKEKKKRMQSGLADSCAPPRAQRPPHSCTSACWSTWSSCAGGRTLRRTLSAHSATAAGVRGCQHAQGRGCWHATGGV